MAARSLDRPVLTPDFCLDLVVRATPWRDRYNDDPDQDLSALGIVDPEQAAQHKARIQSELHNDRFSIAQADIASGPGVSVRKCFGSVLDNAH